MSKPLIILYGEGDLQTPPMGTDARRETGFCLRKVQEGEKLSLPQSRPMFVIGPGCHELRTVAVDQNWRVIYHIGADEILVLDVWDKDTEKTPRIKIANCQRRLAYFYTEKRARAKAEAQAEAKAKQPVQTKRKN